MIRDMIDEKRDTRNCLKIALNARKIVKCESWKENTKADALHIYVERNFGGFRGNIRCFV